MKYDKIVEGKFIERPNRFVAFVEIDGKTEKVHVKNTGRCKELLLPGAKVYLEDFREDMRDRKTQFSLIAVEKNGFLVNMDSQAPNKVVKEALESGVIKLPEMDELAKIQSEKTYGNSRFDFYVEDMNGKKGYIEVKGVTLENEGISMFPDAPTERGLKHVRELIEVEKAGMNGYVVFVIQMKDIKEFTPNDETHKAFGDALREAKNISIMAYNCKVEKDQLEALKEVPVKL